ncbi:MAG: metal-sensing transcriptional repressor [Bellilinea sp.]
MDPEKEEILDRLKFETNRLHRLQDLIQESAPCTNLLNEISALNKALTAIKVDLVKHQMKSSIGVIHGSSDRETTQTELSKIIQLLGITADF